jgi:hypothetical protein
MDPLRKNPVCGNGNAMSGIAILKEEVEPWKLK